MIKKIIPIVSIACLLILTAGLIATTAFRTVEQEAVQVITTGNIKIAAHSDALNEDGQIVPYDGQVLMVPSVETSWILSVENTGNNAAYVRIKLDKTITLANDGVPDDSVIGFDFNDTDWTLKDGYYYYNVPLESGQISSPLFTKVTMDKNAGNLYQGASLDAKAIVTATQVVNNETNVFEASGWPEI